MARAISAGPVARERAALFGLWGPRSGSNLRIGWERARHWLWELESEIEKAEEAAAMAKDEAEEAAEPARSRGCAGGPDIAGPLADEP